ncbi:MAG: hypothetical protein AAB320_04780 [Elusimicrobiota bacterium]
MQKKLFKHGGSYAIDLPVSFVRELQSNTVVVEQDGETLVITPKGGLDGMEGEPEFKTFAEALLHDAMKRPAKLRDAKQVWDKGWDALLKGVEGGKD